MFYLRLQLRNILPLPSASRPHTSSVTAMHECEAYHFASATPNAHFNISVIVLDSECLTKKIVHTFGNKLLSGYRCKTSATVSYILPRICYLKTKMCPHLGERLYRCVLMREECAEMLHSRAQKTCLSVNWVRILRCWKLAGKFAEIVHRHSIHSQLYLEFIHRNVARYIRDCVNTWEANFNAVCVSFNFPGITIFLNPLPGRSLILAWNFRRFGISVCVSWCPY